MKVINPATEQLIRDYAEHSSADVDSRLQRAQECFQEWKRRLFNERSFAAMKRGAYFINTSRGGVMDESALLAALQSGHLAGAALDVRETEPPSRRTFETLDNVILTPHIGSFTTEAQTRTFEAVCDDLDRLLRGAPAINFVNIPQPKRKP